MIATILIFNQLLFSKNTLTEFTFIIFIVKPYKISELFIITIVLAVSLRKSQSAFSVKRIEMYSIVLKLTF